MNRSAKLSQLFGNDTDLEQRLRRIKNFSRTARSGLYHLTNRCNIRCKGCWFFEEGFDTNTQEAKDLEHIQGFVKREAERGVTAPLLIGGEPALHPERIKLFVENMPYVSVSSNGLKKIPQEFDNIQIALTLFGGGPLDDEIRAIGPTGRRFTGLFDKVLKNYRYDPRAGFVFGLSIRGIEHIEDTVKRIADNGNALIYNYYREYDTQEFGSIGEEQRLLDEALRVQQRYPQTVLSHPELTKAIITGESHFGSFGYENCPSISCDHPGNAERAKNGNPILPKFNAYAADFNSLALCCTSGQCNNCRDSQAITSWLLVNVKQYMKSPELLRTWIEIAESYWSQFYWSPFSTHAAERIAQCAS